VDNGIAYPVAENLHLALHQLQHPSRQRVLWVDRICINQREVRERNYQVAQMRAIYEGARLVIVWLGVEDRTSAVITASVERLGMRIVEAGLKRVSIPMMASKFEWAKELLPVMQSSLGEMEVDSPWTAGMVAFLNRPWWSWIWVWQEPAMARRAEFICGPLILD